MLKPRLTAIVNDFFATGGNHDLDKSMEIRQKLIDFLREEDILLGCQNDENVILSRDIISLITAEGIYAETTNGMDGYHYMKSFLQRIMSTSTDNWNYYDLRILVSSMQYTESVEQAIELASKIENRIIKFKMVRSTDNLEGVLACNMCSRLLSAKYIDDVRIDLVNPFECWMIKLENLVEANKNSEYLELLWHITQIRRDIFESDNSRIFTLCDDLIPRYNEQIGQMIRNEVNFYMAVGAFD